MLMMSRKVFDAYVASLGKLTSDAKGKLWAAWQAIDFDDARAARDITIDLMYGLTETYGDAAATIAGDFYAAARAEALGGYYDPVLAENAPYKQVDKQVRYAAGNHLFKNPQTPLQMYRFLAGCLDKDIKAAARNTIIENAKRDNAKVRYARVPSGVTTCTFCLMLASRGFVYHDEKTAGELGQFHSACDCQIVPGFGSNPQWPGYDPDYYYELYRNGTGIKDAYKVPIEGPGAKSINYPVTVGNKRCSIWPGTEIKEWYVYAGKGTEKEITEAVLASLIGKYGGDAEDWRKVFGDAYIKISGKKRHAEVHWYETKDSGPVDIRQKRWR